MRAANQAITLRLQFTPPAGRVELVRGDRESALTGKDFGIFPLCVLCVLCGFTVFLTAENAKSAEATKHLRKQGAAPG